MTEGGKTGHAGVSHSTRDVPRPSPSSPVSSAHSAVSRSSSFHGRVDDQQPAAAQRDVVALDRGRTRPAGSSATPRPLAARARAAPIRPSLIGYQAMKVPCGHLRRPAASASASRSPSSLASNGRVDQHQAAPFLGRQQRADGLVAVAMVHRDAGVAPIAALAAPRRPRGAVRRRSAGRRRAGAPHDLGRAGIGRQAVRVHRRAAGPNSPARAPGPARTPARRRPRTRRVRCASPVSRS